MSFVKWEERTLRRGVYRSLRSWGTFSPGFTQYVLYTKLKARLIELSKKEIPVVFRVLLPGSTEFRRNEALDRLSDVLLGCEDGGSKNDDYGRIVIIHPIEDGVVVPGLDRIESRS